MAQVLIHILAWENNMEPQEAYAYYLERHKRYISFGYDSDEVYTVLFNHAKPFIGSCLEVGTGKGFATLGLARLGIELTTIDTSEDDQAIAEALLRYYQLEKNVTIGNVNAENMPYGNNTYDVVLSVYLLHHLNNPYDVLKEMVRVVTDDGKIVISDFNDKGFDLANDVHKAQGREAHGVGGATIQAARAFIASMGYDVIEYSDTFNDTFVAKRKG